MLIISDKNDSLDFVLNKKDEKVSQKTIDNFAKYIANSKSDITAKDIANYKQLIAKYNKDPFEFSIDKRAVKIFKEKILTIIHENNGINTAAFVELANNGVPLEELSDSGNIYDVIEAYASKKSKIESSAFRDQLKSLSRLGVTKRGDVNETGTSKGIGGFEVLLSLLIKNAEHPQVGDLKVGSDIYEIKSPANGNYGKLYSNFKDIDVTTFDAISEIAKVTCGTDIKEQDMFRDVSYKIVEAALKDETLTKRIHDDILAMTQKQYGSGSVSAADVASISLSSRDEFEYGLFTLQLKAYLKIINAKGIIVFNTDTGNYTKVDASSIKVGEKLSHIVFGRPTRGKEHPAFEIRYR